MHSTITDSPDTDLADITEILLPVKQTVSPWEYEQSFKYRPTVFEDTHQEL